MGVDDGAAMIATTPRTIHLLGDATAEVFPSTERWPVSVRFFDGERPCVVEVNAVTWRKLVAAVEEALNVEAEKL